MRLESVVHIRGESRYRSLSAFFRAGSIPARLDIFEILYSPRRKSIWNVLAQAKDGFKLGPLFIKLEMS